MQNNPFDTYEIVQASILYTAVKNTDQYSHPMEFNEFINKCNIMCSEDVSKDSNKIKLLNAIGCKNISGTDKIECFAKDHPEIYINILKSRSPSSKNKLVDNSGRLYQACTAGEVKSCILNKNIINSKIEGYWRVAESSKRK